MYECEACHVTEGFRRWCNKCFDKHECERDYRVGCVTCEICSYKDYLPWSWRESVFLCTFCSKYALPCCTAECRCGVRSCVACMQKHEHVTLLRAEVRAADGISVDVTFYNLVVEAVLTISCKLHSGMHEDDVISLCMEAAEGKLQEKDPFASGFLANEREVKSCIRGLIAERNHPADSYPDTDEDWC